MAIVCILYTLLSYYRRINDYQTLGVFFRDISGENWERNMRERLFDLFEELLMTLIRLFSESGIVDIALFKDSPEYQYLKSLFDEPFLSKQILCMDKAG